MPEIRASRVREGVIRVEGRGFTPSRTIEKQGGNANHPPAEVEVWAPIALRVWMPHEDARERVVFGESAEVADDGTFTRDVAVNHRIHVEAEDDKPADYTVRAYPWNAAPRGVEDPTPALAEWNGPIPA